MPLIILTPRTIFRIAVALAVFLAYAHDKWGFLTFG